MTRLDWRKLPESDPAWVQREDPGVRSDIQAIIEQSNREPRRIKVEAAPTKAGGHLSYLDAVRKLPSFEKNLSNRLRFVALAGKTDCNGFVHETAVQVLEHVQRTGDCGHALRLVQALPTARRKELLTTWFNQVGPVRINMQKGIVRLAKPNEAGFRPFSFYEARRRAFYEL